MKSSNRRRRPALLTLDVLGDGRQDLEALGPTTWLDRLAGAQAAPAAGTIPGPAAPGPAEAREVAARGGRADALAGLTPPVEESKDGARMTASPGLIAAGVLVGAAFRRWKPGLVRPRGHRNPPSSPHFFPRSMG